MWEKIQADLVITAKSKTCVYNGEPQGSEGTFTQGIDTYVTVEGLKDGDTLTSITMKGIGTDAGEYEITPSDAVISGNSGNYSVSYVPGTLTIEKAPNPAVIVAVAAEKKGGNTVDLSENVKDAVGDVTYTISGEANGCTVDTDTGLFISGNGTGKCMLQLRIVPITSE